MRPWRQAPLGGAVVLAAPAAVAQEQDQSEPMEEVVVTGSRIVFGRLPRDATGTETDAGAYDAIGRRWYAGVRVKF